MHILQMILSFLDTRVAVPASYGPYHLLCLAITAALTVFAVFAGRHHGEKQIRKVLLTAALAVIALEIYKQVNYTFGDGTEAPSFQWYAFPFQFCSTPMYAGLLAALLPKGKVHNALCAYLSTYAVFAGLCVMVYPNNVFISTAGINFQTMVCHGSMVVIGGYLLGSGYVAVDAKTVLKAMPVFACFVSIAALLNEMAHAVGIENFNMFFISPYQACTLPVYCLVHEALPFPLNLMVYVLGFTAAAFLVMAMCGGIRMLASKTHHHKPAYALH